MYVYIQSEKPGWYPEGEHPNRVWLANSLWTVGFYDSIGNWHPESDYDTPEAAAERVHYLNGSNNDDKVIADNMRDYWISQADGAEK
jgi:hypothetical protein